jgi:hypothetical protein
VRNDPQTSTVDRADLRWRSWTELSLLSHARWSAVCG